MRKSKTSLDYVRVVTRIMRVRYGVEIEESVVSKLLQHFWKGVLISLYNGNRVTLRGFISFWYYPYQRDKYWKMDREWLEGKYGDKA